MSAVKFTGLASTELLALNTVLRVTWADTSGYLIGDSRAFSKRFTSLYESIAGLHYGYPISPNPAIKDSKVGVIDFRLRKPATAAELLTTFEVATPHFMEVVSIERLSADKAKVAAGQQGAQDREASKSEEEKRQAAQADANNPFKQLAGHLSHVLGVAVKTAEVALIVGLVLVLLVAAAKAKGAATTILHK